MSDSNPLPPTVSPLREADPNSLNVLIQERVAIVFNTKPSLVSDPQILVSIEYYRKERVRFKLESELKEQKPKGNGRKGKGQPTSVADAIESMDSMFDE